MVLIRRNNIPNDFNWLYFLGQKSLILVLNNKNSFILKEKKDIHKNELWITSK